MVNLRGTEAPKQQDTEWCKSIAEQIASYISTEASPAVRRRKWFSKKRHNNVQKQFLDRIHKATRGLKPGDKLNLRHTTKESKTNYHDALKWATANLDVLLKPGVGSVDGSGLLSVVQNTAVELDKTYEKQMDYPDKRSSHKIESTTTKKTTTTEESQTTT